MNTFARNLTATLLKLQGCAIGSLTSETVVPLKGGKKNPMLGKVTKRAEGANVMFYCNTNTNTYRNMVQKRLVAEGKAATDFTLQPRVWGERVADTPFISHKGELYVEAVYLAPPKKVTYYYNGAEIAKSAIEGFPPETDEAAQGGLTNKVIIRTFKLDSIKQIKMGELSVGM